MESVLPGTLTESTGQPLHCGWPPPTTCTRCFAAVPSVLWAAGTWDFCLGSVHRHQTSTANPDLPPSHQQHQLGTSRPLSLKTTPHSWFPKINWLRQKQCNCWSLSTGGDEGLPKIVNDAHETVTAGDLRPGAQAVTEPSSLWGRNFSTHDHYGYQVLNTSSVLSTEGSLVVKTENSEIRLSWARVQTLPLTSSMTLGKLFKPQGLSFFICKMGIIVMEPISWDYLNNQVR